MIRKLANGELFDANQVPVLGQPKFGMCDQCKQPLVRVENHQGVKLRMCNGCGLTVEEKEGGLLIVQHQGVHRRDGCLMTSAEPTITMATRSCGKCGRTCNDYYGGAE